MFRRIKSMFEAKVENARKNYRARKREEMLVLNSTSIGTTANLFKAKPHMIPSENEAQRKSLLIDAED